MRRPRGRAQADALLQSPRRRRARPASATGVAVARRASRGQAGQRTVRQPCTSLAMRASTDRGSPRAPAAAGGGAAGRRPRSLLALRALRPRAVLDSGVLPGDERAPRVLALAPPPPSPPAPLPAVVVTASASFRTFFRTRGAGRAASASRPACSTPRRTTCRSPTRTSKRHERAAGRVGRGAAQRDGVAPRRGVRVDRRAVRRLRRREPHRGHRDGAAARSTASRSADSSSSTRLCGRRARHSARRRQRTCRAGREFGRRDGRLFERRYGADWAASLEAYDQWSEVHQITVTEPFGTVLVGIGFADYIGRWWRMARRRRWWPVVRGDADGDGRREIVADGGAVPSAETPAAGFAYDPEVPY